MKNLFLKKNLIFLLAGIFMLSLVCPFSVEASGVIEYKVTFNPFALPNNGTYASRVISIWKYDISNMSDEDLNKSINDLKGLSKEGLLQKLGRPVKVLEAKDGNFTLTTFLPKGYYVAFDESVDSFGNKARGFMSFLVEEKLAISSKLEISNQPGRVELTKIDGDSRKLLSGVAFRLYFHKDHPLNNTGDIKAVPLSPDKSSYDENGIARDLFTDENGKIVVNNLPPGEYVFVEVSSLPGYSVEYDENHFLIRPNALTTLEVKNFKDNGGFNFQKLSSFTKGPLEGVKFKLMVMDGDGFRAVQDPFGYDIILKSDENGYFSVSNLPYGTYYIWEISPAENYKTLSSPVEFVVGDKTKNTYIQIINEPGSPPPEKPDEPPKEPEEPLTPPSPIEIPKTGDITILIMSLAGAALIFMGKHFIKEGKERM